MFYIYNGDREVSDMVSFIESDYERSPRRELPKSLDYRAMKKAQKKKKKQKQQQNQDLNIAGMIPDTSSPTFMISAGIIITVFFLIVGYCCAPSVEEETTVEKNEQNEQTKETADGEKSTQSAKKDKKDKKDKKENKTETSKGDKEKSKKESKNQIRKRNRKE